MPFTLNVQTDQEAFDAVVRHLSTMPGRSVTPNGESGPTCRYAGHTEDGKHRVTCAAGALIDASWEAKRVLDDGPVTGTITGLVNHGTVKTGNVSVWLVRGLQIVHDLDGNWTDNRFTGYNELRPIAKGFDLNTDVLDATVAAQESN